MVFVETFDIGTCIELWIGREKPEKDLVVGVTVVVVTVKKLLVVLKNFEVLPID